jgi:hypothetical protein
VGELGGSIHAPVLRAPFRAAWASSFPDGLVRRLVAASIAFVAVFTIAVDAASGGSPRAGELLPDLRAVAPYDVRTSGDGERFVIGFGSTSQNVGEAELKMRGSRASSASLTMSADQLVALKNGKERVYSGAGTFAYITEETHRHWHWLGFMRYELRRATDLSLVNPDVKSGFCVADRQRVPGYDLPPDFPDPTWCEQDNPAATQLVVGMSVGWGDPYEALIEGQEIGVTGVPAGTYYVVHSVNPKRLLRESDYSNNLSAALVHLSWPAGRKSRPQARLLVSCGQTGTNRNDLLVDRDDTDDALCGLRGNDTLRLLGSRGETALGGPGNDRFAGSANGSVLDGGSGVDTADYTKLAIPITTDLNARRTSGGLGEDRLRSIENVRGGSRDDGLRGDRKANVLSGGRGHDVVSGRRGKDTVRGGLGRDTLDGGKGRDRLFGGPGNDSIESRDGMQDTVVCGAGYDTVTADRVDRVAADCENVLLG